MLAGATATSALPSCRLSAFSKCISADHGVNQETFSAGRFLHKCATWEAMPTWEVRISMGT